MKNLFLSSSLLQKLKKPFGKFFNFQHVTEVKKKVLSEQKINLTFLLLMVGASIVATLGLLTDSSVIVMGAMIMAPLYWPMIGVALGISVSDKLILKKALRILTFSVFLGLLVSAATAYFAPIKEITREMQLRSNPTLLDLLIALATSVVGMVALFDSGISSLVAGVAMSLSLMPPLSVAGIAISQGRRVIFWGSFQLFVANAVSVVVIGVIFFYLKKVRSKNDSDNYIFLLGLGVSLMLLLILASVFTMYLQMSVASSR